jgi:PAS domain S-box-containing protein
MGALVVIASTAIGLLMYRSFVAIAEPRALDRLDAHSRIVANDLDAAVSRARTDVLAFRAAVAIDDIMAASAMKGIDPAAALAETNMRRRLAARFAAELAAKRDYLQFRLIGIDKDGRELVRVDCSGPGGAIRIVPDEELRTVGDRPYFKSTIDLPLGEVYVSSIQLNEENGSIRAPQIPTLLVATPILTPEGKPFGIIAINFDFRRAFNDLRFSRTGGAEIYIVNDRGDYLFGPDPTREFGFEFGTPFRIQDDFPALAGDIESARSQARIVTDRAGERYGVALNTIQLAGGPWVTVVETLRYDRLLVAATAIRNTALAGGFATMIVAMFLAVGLARSLTRPLEQMTRAAESLARGDTVAVPTEAAGEIGILAKAFTKMAREVHEKTEALQHEVEERKRLFDSSLDLILITDSKGQFIRVSPSSEAILGYRPEEMVGHSGLEFIHPDDLESTRGEMRAARRGRQIRNFQTRYIHKDGRAVSLEWNGVWSALEQRHFFIGRDNTEQRRLELAERETKETLAAVIDASPVAIICLAPDRTVMVWSRAAEQIFGYTAAETVGQRYKLVPEGNEAEFEMLVDRALAGEPIRDIQVRRRRKDGTIVDIVLSGALMQGPSGIKGVAYALTDVTERNKLEQQLRQAQKMEAVGQLTGGIAHDFNNMLTVITGTIDILAEAVADRPEIAAIAKLISEAADRGSELTGRLLAFARRQPLQPQEVDVNELARDAANLLKSTLGEHIDVEWKLSADVWPALVDPAQLVTALVNLAVNARDAMPDGGKLTIETSNVELDEAYAQAHSEVSAGPYVMVAVSDTGIGIPEALREKVFDPFFTTKAAGKGTGLGLSMIYGFVKQSGGHIKLYSEEGHGTTFKIYLPRAGRAARPLAEEGQVDMEGGHETILVVEDDPIVRNSVTVQLESLGYKVLAAANAQEALAVIDGGAAFDLLFTDVIMTGSMNGRRLAEEAAKRRASLRVVFTSGYTENAIVHHGRLDPGVLLLPKPYRKPDLARIIRKALRQAPRSSPFA